MAIDLTISQETIQVDVSSGDIVVAFANTFPDLTGGSSITFTDTVNTGFLEQISFNPATSVLTYSYRPDSGDLTTEAIELNSPTLTTTITQTSTDTEIPSANAVWDLVNNSLGTFQSELITQEISDSDRMIDVIPSSEAVKNYVASKDYATNTGLQTAIANINIPDALSNTDVLTKLNANDGTTKINNNLINPRYDLYLATAVYQLKITELERKQSQDEIIQDNHTRQITNLQNKGSEIKVNQQIGAIQPLSFDFSHAAVTRNDNIVIDLATDGEVAPAISLLLAGYINGSEVIDTFVKVRRVDRLEGRKIHVFTHGSFSANASEVGSSNLYYRQGQDTDVYHLTAGDGIEFSVDNGDLTISLDEDALPDPLPTISSGDAGKAIVVNDDEDDYELKIIQGERGRRGVDSTSAITLAPGSNATTSFTIDPNTQLGHLEIGVPRGNTGRVGVDSASAVKVAAGGNPTAVIEITGGNSRNLELGLVTGDQGEVGPRGLRGSTFRSAYLTIPHGTDATIPAPRFSIATDNVVTIVQNANFITGENTYSWSLNFPTNIDKEVSDYYRTEYEAIPNPEAVYETNGTPPIQFDADRGQIGPTPQMTFTATSLPVGSEYSIVQSGTVFNPNVEFRAPLPEKGDKGDTGIVSSNNTIDDFQVMTQEAYDALNPPSQKVIYFVPEDD